jgi:CO/xanthine dehydrogenase FAD-binding subunit
MADVYVPETLEDAVGFLAGHAGIATPIAGGTDVLIDTRVGRIDPDWLVDLSPLASLAGISADGDPIRIGALTRVRALELDPELARRATSIVEAARVLGSVQIRTMATLGGNLCHATPSAELPPALLVHDAVAEVAGPEGDRELSLADLFAGPGLTTLAAGELLTAIRLSPSTASGGSCYLRQTVRWSMDLAGVGVAASVEAEDGVAKRARVALGAVAPVPMLAVDAGASVEGTDMAPTALDEAGALAAAACSPISDARGTAEYRRQVVAVLTSRALRIAWLRATGSWPEGVFARPNGILSEDAA